MTRIFLSYARLDAAAAEGLRAALVDAGHDVWVDHEQVAPTAVWREAVARALGGVDLVVVVVSPASLASVACREEVDEALGQGLPIVPVLAADGHAANRARVAAALGG